MASRWTVTTMAESRYRVRHQVAPPIPDAPGYDLKPDPAQATTDAEFVQALGRLRVWAGEPSTRELSRRCGGLPSHSTVFAMLKSESLPPLELVVVFVEALGLPEERERWRAAWRRLRLRVVV